MRVQTSQGWKCRTTGALAAVLIGSVAGLLFLTPVSVAAGDDTDGNEGNFAGVQVTETWLIRWGGRLYGNWADELDVDPPDTTHPAYPAAGNETGGATWRCKECHGWDYEGNLGSYGKGSSHFTGIKGIRGMVGANPRLIEKVLRNSTHGYTKDMIPDDALDALAMFVSWGQIDMERYIDRKTRKAFGDPRRGAEVFQTVCAVCHGLDGREINFETEENPEYIGTVASENPWETLHNIRFGHSGAAMVGLIAFPVQYQVDALSYAQTLPAE